MNICKSWVTAAGIAVVLATSTAARAQPAASAALDELARRAASAGPVRVIVGLSVAARPEGLLGAGELVRQRADIRAAQNAVVTRLLSGTSSRAHALFDTIPFLAAEVDANGMARLRASPLVRDIQEDHLASPGLAQSAPLVNAPTAWGRGYTGSGWAVAVLDTGVDKTHPFLAGRVVSEACYSTTNTEAQSLCPGGVSSSTATDSAMPCATYCNHGTHVAGIAAGGPHPTDSSYGVASAGNLIAVQVFSLFPNYYGAGQGAVLSYSSDQIKGLERIYALRSTHQIAAVNLSLGGGRYTSTCDSTYSGTKAAIDNLRSVGIATVIAAGNDGYKDSISGPACISTAVSVGATCDASSSSTCATGVNGIASYSNIASFVSLLAPGSFIVSSVPGGGYASYNGTSMATPHVAGAWAVLKQWLPGASVTDALGRFRTNGLTVDDLRSGGIVTGMKRIDLAFVGASASGYALTVTQGGSGTGSVTSLPAGINCGADCSENYALGTAVTLSATPGPGSSFAGWSGACSGTGSCTVAMTADRVVTANFAAPVTLAVSRSGSAAALGSVRSSSTGIDCGTDCSESYVAGTSVSLTAAVPAGVGFAGWSGGCTGTAPTCVLTLSTSTTVDARFETQYPLSVTVSRSTSTADGTVTSSPSGISCGADCVEDFNSGTSVKLTARAASGSKFVGWSGACSGTKTTCTVSMTAARSVTATFKR